MSSVPTTGGNITIQGSSFGPLGTDIVLTVNGVNCSKVQYVVPHTSLACEVPEGVGKDQDVFLEVGGQNATSKFSYQGTGMIFVLY